MCIGAVVIDQRSSWSELWSIVALSICVMLEFTNTADSHDLSSVESGLATILGAIVGILVGWQGQMTV